MITRLFHGFPFITIALLLVLGLAAMLFKRNLIKVLMGLSIIESAVNLFLIVIGYRNEGIAPIYTNAPQEHMVLPTVQALTLTAIVIGLATTAMMLSFAMIIYKKYGTVDVRQIRKHHG